MRTAYCTAAFFALVFTFTAFLSPCHAQTCYGMTFTGGNAGYGAIIKFDVRTGNETVVWSFAGQPSDGASPFGSLVYDSINGLFYAMTAEGGSSGHGAIISFNPTTNKDSLVWSFGGSPSDGNYPEGTLVYDARNGLFYGLTESGGNNDAGTIISFDPTTNTDSVVWNFLGRPDGDGPAGDLVYDAGNGLFYGMTQGGGTNDEGAGVGGTIFSFNPATDRDSVLWSFGKDTDGSNPAGSLVYDAGTGLFYAMVHAGGTTDTAAGGFGAIISFNPSTNAESVLWNFAGSPSDGEYPDGSLVYDTGTGSFYGMTIDGGAHGSGSIIGFDPLTNKESLAWSFGNGNDGKSPVGNLVYDAGNGTFYGMTQWGGTNGNSPHDGTIFSFNPADDSESVLWDFGNDTDGSQPWGSLVVYPPSINAGINSNISAPANVTVYPNPGNGVFTITGLNTGQIVEAYNDLGQKISSNIAGSATQQLDISTQADGIYVVRISANDGSLIGENKVVKVN